MFQLYLIQHIEVVGIRIDILLPPHSQRSNINISISNDILTLNKPKDKVSSFIDIGTFYTSIINIQEVLIRIVYEKGYLNGKMSYVSSLIIKFIRTLYFRFYIFVILTQTISFI